MSTIVNQWGFREDQLITSTATIEQLNPDEFVITHEVATEHIHTHAVHTRETAKRWLAILREKAGPVGVRFIVVGEELLNEPGPAH